MSVPGVTIRDTRRSIMPLPGWPICSTMTTLSPSLTSLEMYVSSDTKGIPAMGMGVPSVSLPRLVSVMPIRRFARTASSKNVS